MRPSYETPLTLNAYVKGLSVVVEGGAHFRKLVEENREPKLVLVDEFTNKVIIYGQ